VVEQNDITKGAAQVVEDRRAQQRLRHKNAKYKQIDRQSRDNTIFYSEVFSFLVVRDFTVASEAIAFGHHFF
jgi:hypothetical protein